MASLSTWISGLYVGLGLVDLAIACLIAFGIGFSSSHLAAKMALFVALPIFVGLYACLSNNRSFPLLMLLGSVSTLYYIVWFSRGAVQNGYPILPFHIFWGCLSVCLGGVACLLILRPNHNKLAGRQSAS